MRVTELEGSKGKQREGERCGGNSARNIPISQALASAGGGTEAARRRDGEFNITGQ